MTHLWLLLLEQRQSDPATLTPSGIGTPMQVRPDLVSTNGHFVGDAAHRIVAVSNAAMISMVFVFMLWLVMASYGWLRLG